ncbi:MAG: type II toxin-antitoxin system HicB family antitoxin [Chloroflexota bacterium]|nr:type II toxin-antitoxin system HicB family antitoxin [Chloroflexota bacterium]
MSSESYYKKAVMYSVVLTPELEDGGYSARVPALPECFAQGETVDEAVSNVKEAIELLIGHLNGEGKPIPVEDVHPVVVMVDVPATIPA